MEPGTTQLLFRNAPKEQFPGIHQVGEDDVVLAGNVDDLRALLHPYPDCLRVVEIPGLAVKGEAVMNRESGLDIVDPLDMTGAGDDAVKEMDLVLEGRGMPCAAFDTVNKAGQTVLTRVSRSV